MATNSIRRPATKHLAFAFGCWLALILGSGCHIIHKPVEIEKLLTPLSEANTAQLIDNINRLAAVNAIHGKIDIQFEDTSFATSGIAEKYRTTEGSITLQRPGKVYLVVQGPFATEVAHMTSDGEHFRIAILKGEEKYKRFVRGTNNAVYAKLDTDGKSDAPTKGKPNTEAQTVSALSNLRPQHFTDALLIRAVGRHAAGITYAQSEFFESERDPADPKKRIVRGYYFLDEIQIGVDNSARLLRRFWFDRVGSLHLARLQTFDDKGTLVTDVTYRNPRTFGAEGAYTMPSQIGLTRPQDHYKITITYQSPETLTVNKEYAPEVFVLENKWGLREVDLDAEKPTRTPND